MLLFETRQNPNEIRKQVALEVLVKANKHIELTSEIEDQSKIFVQKGLNPFDALHLASAMHAKADYFCTCDDKFLKRAKKLNAGSISIGSPIELISEVENEY